MIGNGVLKGRDSLVPYVVRLLSFCMELDEFVEVLLIDPVHIGEMEIECLERNIELNRHHTRRGQNGQHGQPNCSKSKDEGTNNRSSLKLTRSMHQLYDKVLQRTIQISHSDSNRLKTAFEYLYFQILDDEFAQNRYIIHPIYQKQLKDYLETKFDEDNDECSKLCGRLQKDLQSQCDQVETLQDEYGYEGRSLLYTILHVGFKEYREAENRGVQLRIFRKISRIIKGAIESNDAVRNVELDQQQALLEQQQQLQRQKGLVERLIDFEMFLMQGSENTNFGLYLKKKLIQPTHTEYTSAISAEESDNYNNLIDNLEAKLESLETSDLFIEMLNQVKKR